MKIAVTGAFGYSGRYIAGRLLAAGHETLTLTDSLDRENHFGGKIRAVPFNFERPELLRDSLRGVDALINTYWVRFNHKTFTHAGAVANLKTLFASAKAAGVRRVVHVSITNPDKTSGDSYFRGKAEVEEALASTGISHCILRPAALFGKEDILINNIAWSLRHFPVFGLFGDGAYKIQPIYVEDLAEAAVEKVLGEKNEIVNAIGPETFTYREFVETIARILGVRRLIVGVPPRFAYLATRLLDVFTGDVMVTREEIAQLMENRLFVDAPPLGRTRFTDWVREHRETLGRHYTNELARRFDRRAAYRSN